MMIERIIVIACYYINISTLLLAKEHT